MKSYFQEGKLLLIKAFKSKNRYWLFWATSFYYFSSLFNLNNKTVYLSCLLLWVVYYFRLKNFRQSLILTTVSSLIFLIGKTWEFQLISPVLLQADNYPEGYITI